MKANVANGPVHVGDAFGDGEFRLAAVNHCEHCVTSVQEFGDKSLIDCLMGGEPAARDNPNDALPFGAFLGGENVQRQGGAEFSAVDDIFLARVIWLGTMEQGCPME